MARAAADGAGEAALLVPACDATPEVLLGASAYLFVCPENLGSLSGAMKEMFDLAYYPLLGQVEGRPYATAIAAGSAGQGAESQIDRIATGWRLQRIAPGMIVNLQAQTNAAILAPKRLNPRQLADCHDLGRAFAEGIAMGIY